MAVGREAGLSREGRNRGLPLAVGRGAGHSREGRCRLPAPRPAAGAMTGANRPAQED
jgi:hypothetical protein